MFGASREGNSTSPAIMESPESLHHLLSQERRNLCRGRQQLVAALPILAKAATGERLRDLFNHQMEAVDEVDVCCTFA